MKSSLVSSITVAVSVTIGFAQQSQWLDLFGENINIFSDKLEITDTPTQYTTVDAESFARQFSPQTAGVKSCTNAVKRVDANNAITLSFSRPSEGIIGGASVTVGVLGTREDALKTMLGRIVAKSMPPEDIAKGFTRLDSEQGELRLVETIAKREETNEVKVLYWLYGNAFAVIYVESGLEESMEIGSQIQALVKKISGEQAK